MAQCDGNCVSRIIRLGSGLEPQNPAHRKAINARIDDIGPALGRVFKKLDENDKRAEERSIQTHRRLDPLVEEIGRLRGKVEIVEKAAVNSTIGGKK